MWEVGTPTAGPKGCFEGTRCAGTILAGNYPPHTDSRLISPSFVLPETTGAEEIHLRFRHWFSYEDAGFVQVREWDEATQSWKKWATVGNMIRDISEVWSLHDIDLSVYAGKKIQIAFYHTADSFAERSGWYVDTVEIVSLAEH